MEPYEYVYSLRVGHEHPTDAIRVDRETPFGNPFIVGRDGVVGECCAKHREWLETGATFGNKRASHALRMTVLLNIHNLRGKKLLCWCAPKDRAKPFLCHAVTLAEFANR